MDAGLILRLLPTMPMIEEALMDAGWECRSHIRDAGRSYRGVRLYHQQQRLQEDILYILRPGQLPADQYSWIGTEAISSQANHISCPGRTAEELLDFLLELFSRYREREEAIDQLLYRDGSLQELCELGAEILDNPVFIHDDWFVMMAMSRESSEIMEPEYLMTSTKGFVPRAVVEDFKYDSDYLETYTHHSAQIWSVPEKGHNSLYVNLWDGPVYRGRLLIPRKNREFRPSDYLIAEVLTQRAMILLRRKRLGSQTVNQSMDDIVFDLLKARQPDPSDLLQLLNMLNWNRTDRFVCVRIKNQQPNVTTVMEHVLHSDLFRLFPGSYIMLTGHEQCVIMNLSKETITLSEIRHKLAPLCRDYCLYAGISSPVPDIRDLHLAYFQAEFALSQAFQLRNEKWIVAFWECAMDYVLRSVDAPLTPWHLVAPDLRTLLEHDRQRGTQYFETLREFLLQERDVPKTAEALIIHRTTLIYRLKKIRSLISANLEDPWQRLYLLLSLRILEQEHNGGTAGV